MMRYLLDTNTCIAVIRKKSQTVLQRIRQYPVTDIAISTITIAELQYGVQKSGKVPQNQQALNQFLLPFLFLDFDYAATQEYGTIRAYLEAQGTPIGSLDMLLAAQALGHALIFVTNNVKEFQRVPHLQIEDWTKP
jgi:tRNA(fMet)-specific endonuclease VapC